MHSAPRRARRPRKPGRLFVGLVLSLVATAGCTGSFSGGLSLRPDGAGASTGGVASQPGSGPAAPPEASPPPARPDGLVTGPGVTDSSITLGLVVDARADRGFVGGARLWGQAVNAAGGICGRRVDFTGGPATSVTAAYLKLAPSALGLVALPDRAEPQALAAMVSADQIPTLEPSGSSLGLTPTGPVVVGSTADIAAINALAYLSGARSIPDRAAVTVIADATEEGTDAVAGARWWAARAGLTLTVRNPADPGDLTGAQAVLVEAGPGAVTRALVDTGPGVSVITTIDGLPDPLPGPAEAGRLLVTSPTPVFGSDHPAVAAVARAFAAAAGPGSSGPGPRLLAGYAVGATWGRLLARACEQETLTRAGIMAALTVIGPAPVDSLLGPADPGLVVGSLLPATRVSSLARVDPGVPGGLAPLASMAAAPGIGDYTPAR